MRRDALVLTLAAALLVGAAVVCTPKQAVKPIGETGITVEDTTAGGEESGNKPTSFVVGAAKGVKDGVDASTPVYILDADGGESRPEPESASPTREDKSGRHKSTGDGAAPAPSVKEKSGAEPGMVSATPPAVALKGVRASEVQAASHDDNEEFPFYQRYCEQNKYLQPAEKWNVSERYIVRIVDKDSAAVPFVDVTITGKGGDKVFTARTPTAGEVMLFPFMDLSGYKAGAIADYSICVGSGKPQPIKPTTDNRIIVKLDQKQQQSGAPVQICFLLDATGSMRDEIDQLKDVIFSIHSRVASHPCKPKVEFATVAYRDRGEEFVVRGYNFTASIDTFQGRLETIKAAAGGDYPEDINAGLACALDSLSWKPGTARFIFLIGDAPPHLDYDDQEGRDYAWAMRAARQRGTMVVPIGASGLQPEGEFIYRQMGVTTRGPFVFLHYGEQGESEGTASVADPGKVSHHTGSNYAVRRLDDIVVDIIFRELGYVTPSASIVRTYPKPQDESDMLDSRMENLLLQVVRGGETLAKKKVVIAPMQYSDSAFRPLADYLWALAIEKMVAVAPGLTVVERARLQEILKEHALDLSGATDRSGEAEVGKLLSSDYIIFSGLSYLGAARMCHMRMVECASGGLMGAARIRL